MKNSILVPPEIRQALETLHKHCLDVGNCKKCGLYIGKWCFNEWATLHYDFDRLDRKIPSKEPKELEQLEMNLKYVNY